MANNMKSNIFSLLLFLLLLLLHNSLSVSAGLPLSSIVKGLSKIFSKRGSRKTGNNWVDQVKQHLHDSPPPAPPNAPSAEPEIKDLSLVKQYFYDFGYIDYSDPFTDYLDSETTSAIKTYQHFFNLNVNGELDNETLTQITLPRCAVPDLNFTYELDSTNNVSWPKGKWYDTKLVLTYGFHPANQLPLNFTKVFTDAFKRWSEAITELNLTRLNFTEAKYNDSDIKIGFYNFSDVVEDTVVGATIVRFQNDSHGNKTVGDMRLDGTKYWVLPSDNGTWSWEDDDFYLETVAMHQIGHLLGLSHSSNNESVMYPSILPTQQKKVQLSEDDKENIKQLYTTTSDTSITQTHSGGYRGSFTITLFGSSTLLVTTLSLGIFVLLY